MSGLRVLMGKKNQLIFLVLASIANTAVLAGKPEFELAIKQHLFEPSVLIIPANTKVKLWVSNKDATPEEFESYELNREKVVLGGQRALIFIGPLAPGEYPFFGEFNPKSAQGKIIAE